MSEDDKTKVIYELGLIQEKLNELSLKYDLKFEFAEIEGRCIDSDKTFRKYIIKD